MKRLIAVLFTMMMMFVLTACGASPTPSQNAGNVEKTSSAPKTPPAGASSHKILVAYFSRAGENYGVGTVQKGNTEKIAEMTAQQTGGALFKIEPMKAYPAGYKETTDVAKQEMNDKARPAITGHVDNMAEYDTIFLGYPIWWGDAPMAVYTFLEDYDFTGKTVVLFSTHEGSGFGNSVQSLQAALPKANVLQGFTMRGTVAQNGGAEAQQIVGDWLRQNGYAQ